MDLTRRQLAGVFATLYAAGGALLLTDYLAGSSGHGAHLPLAWHVYPISLAVQLLTYAASGSSGPLDADWPVQPGAVIAAYIAALLLSAAAIIWLISSRSKSAAEENGKDRDQN